ncbi:MAG: hypothetical protein PVF27_03305 [Gemmatimonadales bacterium]|jgi:hypothetical protein
MCDHRTLYTGLSLILAASLVVPGAALAQDPDDWCDEWRDRDRGYACEVREYMLDARDLVAVDAAPNGGIHVEAWDRNEIRVLARVSAHDDTDAEARELVERVEVVTSGRSIRSDGPRTRGHRSWSVSFRVYVPARSNLDLESTNGGISVDGIAGDIRFHTTNGGVTLDAVGGDVRGGTTNGSLRVTLAGSTWQGSGLDVETTNGGVRLEIPDGYNAHLVTGTTNGGMRFDFPVTVQGRINRRLSVDLGAGGPTIRVMTTNGGVVVQRSE